MYYDEHAFFSRFSRSMESRAMLTPNTDTISPVFIPQLALKFFKTQIDKKKEQIPSEVKQDLGNFLPLVSTFSPSHMAKLKLNGRWSAVLSSRHPHRGSHTGS